MDYVLINDDDYIDCDDDDDGVVCTTRGYISDSDDETSTLAAICKIQQGNKNRRRRKSKVTEERDEFESDMAAELDSTIKGLIQSTSNDVKSDERNANHEPKQYYDPMYFDSDDSDPETTTSSAETKREKRDKKQRPILSNDDLFYDPLMDDADEEWANNHRWTNILSNQQNRKKKCSGFKPQPLPQSDAVLNCPACFTTLCLDCQRHEVYKNQYRAMFVFHCTVDRTESLHFAVKEEKRKKKKRRKKNRNKMDSPTTTTDEGATTNETPQEEEENDDDAPTTTNKSNDLFHPVKCSVCNTKVGLQDIDTEVYHFFNVLSSY